MLAWYASSSVQIPTVPPTTTTFEAVDEGPYAFDLRAAAVDDRLNSWLAEEHRTRYVGSVVNLVHGDDSTFAETDLVAVVRLAVRLL